MKKSWTVPDGWAWTTMGEISDVVGGGTPSTQNPEYFMGEVPWITPADLSGYRAKRIAGGQRSLTRDGLENSGARLMPANSVLMSSRAPVGYVALASNEISTNQGFKSFILEDELFPDFFYYYLQYAKPLVLGLASGTTFLEISSKNAARIPAVVPPAAEQRRIVDSLEEVLSDLDAGVAALERVKAKLTLYRASVLKAAVDGSLTADWRAEHPDIEPASVLLERILVERRRRWEEGQLAKFKAKGQEPPKHWRAKYKEPGARQGPDPFSIPDGWTWSNLGECFEVHVGATPSRAVKSYWNGDIPWVASGEVQFQRIAATRERITKQGIAASSTRMNPAGSVILNMIGEGATRGKAAILGIDACNNQNCAALLVPLTPVEPGFVYMWLFSRYQQTRELGSGNNQPALNKRIVESIPIPLPPQPEQAEIVDRIEGQLSVIDHVEADIDDKLQSAQTLRQAILRHAFSGQLVPQDPNDEPASELLKRIAAERETRTRQAGPAPRGSRPRALRQPAQRREGRGGAVE